MPFNPRKSVTFIELLIAIVLLSVIILAVNNVNVFSRYHLVSADRRAKIQNDVSLCLEHMTKNLSQAIGNEALGVGVVWTGVSGGTYYLTARVDTNPNGIAEGWLVDYISGYKLNYANHRFYYCNNCFDSLYSSCVGNEEVLAQNITAFSASKNLSGGNNYITVDLTACWDPAATASACDTQDNPSVTMSTTITLPSVSSS